MIRRRQARHPRLILRISPFGALWSSRQIDPAEGDYVAHGGTPGEALDALLAKTPGFGAEELPVVLDLRERPVIVIDLVESTPEPDVVAPFVVAATSKDARCEGLRYESSDPYGAAVGLLKAAGLFDGIASIRVVTQPEFKAYCR